MQGPLTCFNCLLQSLDERGAEQLKSEEISEGSVTSSFSTFETPIVRLFVWDPELT